MTAPDTLPVLTPWQAHERIDRLADDWLAGREVRPDPRLEIALRVHSESWRPVLVAPPLGPVQRRVIRRLERAELAVRLRAPAAEVVDLLVTIADMYEAGRGR